MHNTPLGWRVQLVTGIALALMAVAAVRVDILNNLDYGRTVSSELATILVLAAIGVVALPTAASLLAWSRHIKLTIIVCVMLTMGATHFKMKTLAHVATEMALHVLAYNIKRVIAILGVPELIGAIWAFLSLLAITIGLTGSFGGAQRPSRAGCA